MAKGSTGKAKEPREKISVYFDRSLFLHLKRRAEREFRTVPNLIEFLTFQMVKDDMEAEKKAESGKEESDPTTD